MSRTFRACFLVAVLTLTAGLWGAHTSAQESAAPAHWGEWEQARTHYDAGRLDEALAAFLTQPASENPNYYYNVGTIYYRLGRPGAALAYLERANRLAPHEPNIQHNLQLARNRVAQLVGADRMDPVSNTFESMADRIPLEQVRAGLGLLAIALGLIWLRFYWKTRNLKQTFVHPTALVAIVAFAITGAFYGAQRIAEENPPAICLQPDSVRSGPGGQFLELSQLQAGVKVRLTGATSAATETRAGSEPELWRQVRYSESGIGWIRASSLLPL